MGFLPLNTGVDEYHHVAHAESVHTGRAQRYRSRGVCATIIIQYDY